MNDLSKPCVGDKYTISLITLFDNRYDGTNNTVATEYGEITHEHIAGVDYYDFNNVSGLPCMDGETCIVVSIEDDRVTLIEEWELTPFALSLSEFNECATRCATDSEYDI